MICDDFCNWIICPTLSLRCNKECMLADLKKSILYWETKAYVTLPDLGVHEEPSHFSFVCGTGHPCLHDPKFGTCTHQGLWKVLNWKKKVSSKQSHPLPNTSMTLNGAFFQAIHFLRSRKKLKWENGEVGVQAFQLSLQFRESTTSGCFQPWSLQKLNLLL
jgi:hypothetical protein